MPRTGAVRAAAGRRAGGRFRRPPEPSWHMPAGQDTPPGPLLSRFPATLRGGVLTTGRCMRHEQHTEPAEQHPAQPRSDVARAPGRLGCHVRGSRLARLGGNVSAQHARPLARTAERPARAALRQRLRRRQRARALRTAHARPALGGRTGLGPGGGAPRADAAVRRARHRPAASLADGVGGVGLTRRRGAGGRRGARCAGGARGRRTRRACGAVPGDAAAAVPRHGRRGHGAGAELRGRRHRGGPARFPLAGRPRHPAALAPRPRDPALGRRTGGPCGGLGGGTDIDFSSRRSGC
jgi:hypothetical protein